MQLDSESRQLLEDSAREWLLDTCPVSEFRARRDAHDIVSGNDLWPAMAELGWAGLLVPEALGGSGLGLGEMAIILEQAGRNLTPSPILSTAVLGVYALLFAEQTDLTQSRLEQIAAGQFRVALAIDESHHHEPSSVACVAKPEGTGWILNGAKTAVAESRADAYLVSARTSDEGRLGLFLVPAEGVKQSTLKWIDHRDYADLSFEDIPVERAGLLQLGDENCDLLDKVLDRGRIALAAEMLGTAWAAFDITMDYMKVREQFGQLIGSFQALQHRAAGMYVNLEVCRSVLQAAVAAVDSDDEEIPSLAAQAKALIGETLHLVTNECIQLHGGIGMTDEHDAGLFLKRARVTEQLYGSGAFQRDRFANLRGF